MSPLLRTGLAAAALALSACQTLPPTKGAPAILINASEAVRAELTKTVSQALNGASITITPDTLTTSSSLIIERAGRGSLSGDPMSGRRMDRPDHFTLSLSDGNCVLTHEETDTHYALKTAKCEVIT